MVAINLFMQSWESIRSSEVQIETKYDNEMIIIAIGGLAINLIGLAFFQQDESNDTNMYGLFLHVLADLLGSISTLTSCYLVKYHSLYLSDSICALIKSCMIFVSILPLLSMSC